MRNITILLLSTLAMLVIQRTVRAQEPVILSDETEIYPIAQHIEILEDKAGVWTIEDVTSPELASQFEPFDGESPSFGFTDSAYWLRVSASNQAEDVSNWLLRLDGEIFYIDFYSPSTEDAVYEVVRTGTMRAFSTREISHPSYLFALDVGPGQTKTIHLRLESEGSMIAPLSIMSSAQIWQKDLAERVATGIILGALAILAAYKLILFLYLRDRTCLFFSLFLASNFMLYLWFGDIAHWLLRPESGRFNAVAGQFFFALTMIFMLAFAEAFLSGRIRSDHLRKALLGVMLAFAVLLPFILLADIGITDRFVIVLTIVACQLHGSAIDFRLTGMIRKGRRSCLLVSVEADRP